MPCISQFFGIVIYTYYNDHAPPHFHAEYSGNEELYEIQLYAREEIAEGFRERFSQN